MALVRVDPGNDEHRVAARHRPADEGIVGPEIEDVELVDPGRHDQQRLAVHRLGRRLVLDELDQPVLKDHRARRGGDVAADLEGVHVGLPGAQAVPGVLEVLGELAHPPHQALAPGLAHFAQHHRVGQREVGGRERIHDLASDEVELLRLAAVEPLDAGEAAAQPARIQQIGLLEKVEDRVVRPFGVAEAVVALLGRDHRLGLPAHHAGRGRGPERLEIAPQLHLGLQHRGRVDIDPARGGIGFRVVLPRRGQRAEPVRPAFLPLLRRGAHGLAQRRDRVVCRAAILVLLRHLLRALHEAGPRRSTGSLGCRRRKQKRARRHRHARLAEPRRWRDTTRRRA